MSYKCKDCGNTEKFEANATDSITVLMNNEGDYIETLDHDSGELNIEGDGIRCHECNSENVEYEK